jgi:ParB/RepB/Spo0J family partition protein
MTKVQKITLSPSRDIPFNKLVLSQSNVRRVKAGVSIEQLAESIAQRTLLQSLNVRAVVDTEGNQTGMFEVPAGGRRYRALELLVKQKRMAKTQPVPCVVREGGIAEDDSLAENDERVGLHPLDQFRAFKTLSDTGLSEEDIAARHFVSPAIVKQRLRLASVSPKLHEVYAEDGMTLEQLMAFSVTADQVRQEQVWENVSRSGYDEPYKGKNWPPKTRHDSKYGLLFRGCVAHVVDVVGHMPLGNEPRLKVVLEDGHRNANDALRIYESIISRLGQRKALSGLSYANKKDSLPLAAADLFAYSAWGKEVGQKPIGEPKKATISDQSYRDNLFRVQLNRDSLDSLHELAIKLANEKATAL